MQLEVSPWRLRKVTLPFLSTVTQATCFPSSVPHISTLTTSLLAPALMKSFWGQNRSRIFPLIWSLTRTVLASSIGKRRWVARAAVVCLRPYSTVFISFNIMDKSKGAGCNNFCYKKKVIERAHPENVWYQAQNIPVATGFIYVRGWEFRNKIRSLSYSKPSNLFRKWGDWGTKKPR